MTESTTPHSEPPAGELPFHLRGNFAPVDEEWTEHELKVSSFLVSTRTATEEKLGKQAHRVLHALFLPHHGHVVAHLTRLLEACELRHLRDKLCVLHRCQGVLVLHLRHQQLHERIFALQVA